MPMLCMHQRMIGATAEASQQHVCRQHLLLHRRLASTARCPLGQPRFAGAFARRSILHRRSSHCRPLNVGILDPLNAAWNVNAQDIAGSLFATSIFPYAGFLYFLTKSKQSPPLTLFGFYFLLVFVFATIPAGIYAKTHYGTILANVDWLHGSAESLLTVTNLLIVLGLRRGIREAEDCSTSERQGSAAPFEQSQRQQSLDDVEQDAVTSYERQ